MQRNRLKNIINKSKDISNPIGVFDKFRMSLPKNILVDDNYRLESAWKAYGSPKNYEEALWQGLIQPIDENTVKLPSIGYNEETDEYEYLNKGRENETVNKDIRVWDNDVIPLVKELKLGGFIRVYDEEKDCWKYSKNKSQEALNNELINYFKGGGPTKYTNGQKCDSEECALFSNGELRNSGYMPRGNAWNLQDVDLLYSGYNTDNYPQTYNLLDMINYNNEASNNFYKNFDSKTLDKDSAYIVNMYYQGSPAQERAYNEGRDKMTGTHTGYVTWNPDTNRWEVTHNIHGTIHVDPFTLIQGGNKKYGITGIFTPRKNNIFNQLRSVLGLGEGGVIESEQAVNSFLKSEKSGEKEETDNDVSLEAFKQGGQMNVIPDVFKLGGAVIPSGSLHAHKNHMQLASEGLVTPKGIPVISEENGEILQLAEIEREEVIFDKQATTDIEKLYKKFNETDKESEKNEIAIKAGKILTDIFINNTEDNTGLIEKVAEKNNLEYNK